LLIAFLLLASNGVIDRLYKPLLKEIYGMTVNAINLMDYDLIEPLKESLKCIAKSVEISVNWILKLVSEHESDIGSFSLNKIEKKTFTIILISIIYSLLLLMYLLIFVETVIVLGVILALGPILLASILIPPLSGFFFFSLNKFITTLLNLFLLGVMTITISGFSSIAYEYYDKLASRDKFELIYSNISVQHIIFVGILLLIIFKVMLSLTNNISKEITTNIRDANINEKILHFIRFFIDRSNDTKLCNYKDNIEKEKVSFIEADTYVKDIDDIINPKDSSSNLITK